MKKDLIKYSYNLIDMKDIDCDIFLNQNNPEALVLAILCDFKDKKPKDVLQFIIDKLKVYTKDNLNEYRKYLMMLGTLSSNRNLQKELEMLRTTAYKDLPGYRFGIEEGIEKGIEKERQKTINILYSIGLDINSIADKLNISKDEVLKYLNK